MKKGFGSYNEQKAAFANMNKHQAANEGVQCGAATIMPSEGMMFMGEELPTKQIETDKIIPSQWVDDEPIVLYHATDRDGLESIIKDGKINEPAYFTPRMDIAKDYGEYVIEIKIPKNKLIVDRESYENQYGDDSIDAALDDEASVYVDEDVQIGKSYEIHGDNDDYDD